VGKLNESGRSGELDELDNAAYHLSTTMYPAHRKRVLDEIRARLKEGLACRVVSTSMIEAGVDIDFPALYREKAGLDSIIQAAGRCNREGRSECGDAVVKVFTSEDTAPAFISQNVAAFEHAQRNYEDIASLEAIQGYFEQLLYMRGDEALDKGGKDGRGGVLRRFNDGARSASFPFAEVAKTFKLINENTRSVIIPVGEEGRRIAERLRFGERSKTLLRQAQKYSVSLYECDFRKLQELGGVITIDEELFELAVHYYDERFGVTLSPTGGKGIIC
jgi:CRISPR-associated endonuclease/helicase Cas3